MDKVCEILGIERDTGGTFLTLVAKPGSLSLGVACLKVMKQRLLWRNG